MTMDGRIFFLQNSGLAMLYRRPWKLLSRQFWY